MAPSAVQLEPSTETLTGSLPASPAWHIISDDAGSAAIAILGQISPSAADETRGRVAALESGLDDLVEEARVTPGMDLLPFLRRVSSQLRLRAALRARARQLTAADDGPELPPIEADAYRLAVSVRRWRDGRELREEQSRRLGPIRQALAAAEREIDTLVCTYRRGRFTTDRSKPEYQSGLTSQDDEFLRRLEPLLSAKITLERRVARLDSRGDDGRSPAVLQALSAAGGADTVRDMLAPTMGARATQMLGQIKGDIGDAEQALSALDPDSRRHAATLVRLDGLRARADAFAGEAETQRRAAADELVLAAITGRRDAVASLANAIRRFDGKVADELEQLITRGDELIATVAEMIQPMGTKP